MTDETPSTQSMLREALALHQQGELLRAEQIYRAIRDADIGHFEATHLLGVIALQTGRTQQGIALIRDAIALKPDSFSALNNLGKALLSVNDPAGALACFDASLRIAPASLDALMHRGVALVTLHRLDEALATYRGALALKPELAELHRNCGHILVRLGRYEDSFAAYDRAYQLQNDLPGVEAYRLHAKMLLCDWSGLQPEIDRLAEAVRAGKPNAQPFIHLAVSSSPHEQLQCARAWTTLNHPASPLPAAPRTGPRDRIRIAYISADFREHALGVSVVEMFELHDRSKFAITAISLAASDGSSTAERIRRASETFIEAGPQSDDQIARSIRDLGIDIVVDLMGFTEGARAGILAKRAAPLQAHYMGYAGTMGAPYLDYIIADKVAIPDRLRGAYQEKVVALPGSFFVADTTRAISDRCVARADLGLPDDAVVFCCFNNVRKITPQLFAVWMDILRAVPGGVLWLSPTNATAIANLKQEAGRRGVDGERLIFAARLESAAEHLGRHRAADLFLDTAPYNAHATALDALWAGLPVLTCAGDTFAGRVAASLLEAVGLPELISTNLRDYRDLAVALAADPARRGAIAARLARNRITSSLFDARYSVRKLEAAYTEMFRRYRQGLPADHIAIAFEGRAGP